MVDRETAVRMQFRQAGENYELHQQAIEMSMQHPNMSMHGGGSFDDQRSFMQLMRNQRMAMINRERGSGDILEDMSMQAMSLNPALASQTQSIIREKNRVISSK